MTDLPLLSLIIWLPVLGAILLLFVKGDVAARWVGFGVTALVFILFAVCFGAFKPHIGDPQFVERMPWIESLGVSYYVGADGISILLAGITALMWPLALLGTWTIVTERVRAYQVFMLLMETTLMGVFFSLDLFQFFLFWEGMLIPMYFLIGIWGYERSSMAALKFFLFAIFGSLLMLAAVITLAFLYHQAHGVLTFEMAAL
ncbi:MAG: proton-conducting transporter membrane subunit, partial [Gemmatimonadetes bacterium]|nr:proton-conducting transporter membrane subunit [Gemmatimonadota bacterium]